MGIGDIMSKCKGIDMGMPEFILHHSHGRCLAERESYISDLEKHIADINHVLNEGENEQYRDYCREFITGPLSGILSYASKFEDRDVPHALPRHLFDLCCKTSHLVSGWIHIYDDDIYDAVESFVEWEE